MSAICAVRDKIGCTSARLRVRECEVEGGRECEVLVVAGATGAARSWVGPPARCKVGECGVEGG